MMRTNLLLFLLLIKANGFAQMPKADAYFSKGEYTKAIPIYKKETNSENPGIKQEALQKLANSYRLMRLYPQAEDTYRQLVANGSQVQPETHHQFAQVLKSNKKYEEAAKHFATYNKLKPDDLNARKELQHCIAIITFESKPREYTVTNMSAINTPGSEFSPLVVNKELLFIAERGTFDVVNGTLKNNRGQLFFHLHSSEIKGNELQTPKPFSKKLNTESHDGPACLSADGKTLYFTRVSSDQKKKTNNAAKIYTGVANGSDWDHIKLLDLHIQDHTVAHPSISSDNKTIYFTSNLPGGFGGKDIWMCEKKEGSWSQPKNLGPDINTAGDEMFPLIREKGVLYFSSSGLPGFGGLDIFSAKKIQDKWILNRNEGLNLNSNADDFGITFLNDSIGFFSSNREGGKGLDDIYRFVYKNKSMEFSGNVLLTEDLRDYAKFKKILLLDENGKAIDSTFTDAKGHFNFKNLDADKKYMASVVETDPVLIGKARFYFSQNDSTIHRVSSRSLGNRFVFKNLPVQTQDLPELFADGDLVFAGTLKYGDKSLPLKKARLRITNDFGDVVEETYTNEYGAFAFRNIPADQNYLVAVEEFDIDLPEGSTIVLSNRSGKDVRTFYKTKDKFNFKVLQTDKTILEEMNADDANLVMGLHGYLYDENKRPLANTRIKILGEDGLNAHEWITDAYGRFSFKNLDADKSYIFEVYETDPALKDVKRIYIAENTGKIYKVVELLYGKFSFKLVEADKFLLGEFVADDPWLKVAELKKNEPSIADTVETKSTSAKPAVSITIVENIYYAYGDHKLDQNAQSILNKAAHVLQDNPKLTMEISSHTDSKASADFNMTLSRKRAQTAVDYLVNNGISSDRLKATGYGETKLLNNCADGIDCSDDLHKINRRTEFKIMTEHK